MMTNTNMALYHVLRHQGVDEDQATAAARWDIADLATKADLALVKAELKSDLALTKAELLTAISDLRAELFKYQTQTIIWSAGIYAAFNAVVIYFLRMK